MIVFVIVAIAEYHRSDTFGSRVSAPPLVGTFISCTLTEQGARRVNGSYEPEPQQHLHPLCSI